MQFEELQQLLNLKGVTLVAVSKTKPIEEIQKLYDKGQRIFGENKVQEILIKAPQLPPDIRWHMIGHLQKNKVKQLLPVVNMIQSIDGLELLKVVNNEASKLSKTIDVLLEVKIATEESKYGLSKEEVFQIAESYLNDGFENIRICGLMGMASFSDDAYLVKNEFIELKNLFEDLKIIFNNRPEFSILSMGMSGDYQLAIEAGSNMVRIGSLLFGHR